MGLYMIAISRLRIFLRLNKLDIADDIKVYDHPDDVFQPAYIIPAPPRSNQHSL